MGKITLLLLLILASFAAVWGADAKDTPPKTCTNYAAAEEIIKTRKKLVSLKTKGRAPVCTNVYSFTYVRPGSSMTFNSPVKKWKTPTKINCGLWFWTDDGYSFDVKCSTIDVKEGDNMVVYDIDFNSVARVSNAVKKDAHFTVKSKNIAIGLEMTRKRRKPSYCCEITTVPTKSKTYILGGLQGYNHLSYVQIISEGKLTSLPNLPFGNGGHQAVVHDAKLYSCGGRKGPKKCVVLDLEAKSPSWKSSLSLPVDSIFATTMAVEDNLWILIKNLVHIIPFKTGSPTSHKLPSGLSVEQFSVGGGDELNRFVVPSLKADVWINTNANKPGEWAKIATLAYKARFRSCMIRGMDIYVTGGQSSGSFIKVAERVNLIDYRTHRLANMNSDRATHVTGIINNNVIVLVGYDHVRLDTAEVYNPVDNTWTKSSKKLKSGKVNFTGYITTY